MKAKRVISVSVVVVLIGLLLLVGYAAAASPITQVNGGGTAEIVDSQFPEAIGTVTNFAVSAKVYEDGTATGHFTCVIPPFVTVSGTVEEGWFLGGDPSTVRLVGTSKVVDHFGGNPPAVVPDFFILTLTEGGPGEGGFDYTDSVVTEGDTEVLLTGRIDIRD